MLRKLRERMESEKGFTLIELLVVILIIGILAAIALPAFLGQRQKAQDAEAKTAARTAATAMKAYYTENRKYDGATKAEMETIEPSLKSGAGATLTVTGASGDSYKVEATSDTGNKFSVSEAAGVATRDCSPAGKGGCKSDSKW